MKVIYNKYLPPKDFGAINIFGMMFLRYGMPEPTPKRINHESIHSAQGKELLWLFFYLWYGIEWVIRLIQYDSKRKAYYNMSFEREAYANQRNLEYLKKRKRFAFIKYLKLDNNGKTDIQRITDTGQKSGWRSTAHQPE